MPLYEEAGDATDVRGRVIVAHVCNDIGRWGAGFTRAVDARWPDVRSSYLAWEGTRTPTLRQVGQVQFVTPLGQPSVVVANMIAQRGTRGPANPVPLDMPGLVKCFHTVVQAAKIHGYAIIMPRVGCGLAGGQWSGPEGVRAQLERVLEDYPSVYVTVRVR